MTPYKIVWECKIVHDLPPGRTILNANLPYGSGDTPEEALAALHAHVDSRSEDLAAQTDVVPQAAA